MFCVHLLTGGVGERGDGGTQGPDGGDRLKNKTFFLAFHKNISGAPLLTGLGVDALMGKPTGLQPSWLV